MTSAAVWHIASKDPNLIPIVQRAGLLTTRLSVYQRSVGRWVVVGLSVDNGETEKKGERGRAFRGRKEGLGSLATTTATRPSGEGRSRVWVWFVRTWLPATTTLSPPPLFFFFLGALRPSSPRMSIHDVPQRQGEIVVSGLL